MPFVAAILSLIAGLATGVGGIIGLLKKPSKRWLGSMLGFTAGVMITVAFMDLIVPAWEESGWVITLIGFTAGALLMFCVDFILPHIHFNVKEGGIIKEGFLHKGLLIAIGIAIHNLPEGIAVGAGYAHAPQFGVLIALAIAIHNVPEGIATVIPLRAGGLSKGKALGIAIASGLVEPVGALFTALVLVKFQTLLPFLIPLGLAIAGGVMVFITLDELVPMCKREGEGSLTSLGILAGCVTMLFLSGLFGI